MPGEHGGRRRRTHKVNRMPLDHPDDLPADSGPPIPPRDTLTYNADTGEPIVCTPRIMPHEEDGWVAAAARALGICASNGPPMLFSLIGMAPEPSHLAVMVSKYWGPAGVRLTVGFMDNPDAETRRRILLHANAWGKFCNVKFTETATATDAQVRIARAADGYWSYLGTDILGIPRNQPTMNLQGFTASTPDREYTRVVPHEFGHTLGFPHEHMRREIVARIDPEKAIAYFKQTQGWNANTVRQQVLTPLEENSIRGTPLADTVSIMCYQLPGSIMRDGQPVLGGSDIDAMDATFVATLYPLEVVPPPPPPPPPPPGTDKGVATFTLPDGTSFAGPIPRIH